MKKPSRWPDELNNVLAKSAAKGGETLAQHTWDVLYKLSELRNLRPTLPALVATPNLWHCLFWTCLLHDFGKSPRGFQAMLAGKGKWNQRHEVLSLAFVDWIAPGLSEDEQRWITAAIVSHHRDAQYIERTYVDCDPDPLVPLLAELEPETVSKLWRWLDRCAADWIIALDFAPKDVQPLPLLAHDDAVRQVLENGVARVRYWLNCYEDWVKDLEKPLPLQEVSLPVLLRGLTTSADHMASAHLKRMPEPVQEDWRSLAARILKPGQEVYIHQEKSAAESGRSAVLIAPTGSGKTEAASYWALGDGKYPIPRLFYTLPFQASMNAMFARLRDEAKGFGAQAVGLQHGRALQAMYARLIDQETGLTGSASKVTESRRSGTVSAQVAYSEAAWAKNVNLLHARPIKVFSPYQMLKAAFQLRGFEAMLADYTQAAFIFDEIHAYEPKRLALILAMVKFLRESYGARFFIMSATFPQIIRSKLIAALGPHKTIVADNRVFEKFRRHRLALSDGDLLEDGIERIVGDVKKGNGVLACVNTVRRAQLVRDKLVELGLPRDQVLLIHSRYITKHRIEREKEIMQRCGIDVDRREQPGFVLVATQVVEVSLNIDLDTIYSDPAPLEALLQRFGRVNRACKKGICPVHVFKYPNDGQFVYGRHKDEEQRGHIVRVTLAELEQHNGEVIDEAKIDTWLDNIYNDPILQAQWEEEYNLVAQSAEQMLTMLRPFNSDAQKEDQFEEMFDNVDVLPERYEKDYVECIARGDFIEASSYFVGISQQKYMMLKKHGLVRPVDDPAAKWNRWVVRLPYDEDKGLSFDPTNKDPDWD